MPGMPPDRRSPAAAPGRGEPDAPAQTGAAHRQLAEPKRRTRSPDTRRSQLLAAARELVAEQGVNSVSIGQITARAGLAKGTFYLYFASRDELIEALRADTADEAADILVGLPVPAAAEDWPDYLERIVDLSIGFVVEHSKLHDVLMSAPHIHEPGRGEMVSIDRLRARLRDVVAAAVAAGVSDLDPAIAGDLFVEILHSAGHEAVAPGGDPARVRKTTRTIVRRAFLKPSRF